MDNLYNYLTEPTTIINAVVLIFTLGVTRANLNTKLKELEKRIEKIEELDLDARLTQIQTDLTRIKAVLDELKQK